MGKSYLQRTAGSMVGPGSLVQEAAYGWRYIIVRPGLFGQLLLFMAVNFLLGTVSVLATPLVLGFALPEILGTVLVTIAGYLHPRLRLVEQKLPDALADAALSHVKQHAPVGHETRLERISERGEKPYVI